METRLSESGTERYERDCVTVGVDVGGTKTHLALSSGEQEIVPSYDWHREGLDRVAEGIVDLLRSMTPAFPAALAVGSHGCNDRVLCARLEDSIRDRLGDLPILVVNDAELLLPSVRAPAGVGLIAGTGSVVVGYDADGELAIAGGWGGYIGDEGSSTGMFRDAARAVPMPMTAATRTTRWSRCCAPHWGSTTFGNCLRCSTPSSRRPPGLT